MTDISAPTLVQHASDRLRQDILDGVMPPMHKLKVEVLSENYRISSTPLREALNRLAQEGLVTADMRRGFRVAAMSLADLRDIIRLRQLVECDALVDSMRLGALEWEDTITREHGALQKAATAVGQAAEVGQAEWAHAHRRFHMATLSACQSARQLEICGALFDQAERYRRLSARQRAIPRDRVREHEDLLRSVLNRDTDLAVRLHRQHLERTADAIGSNIDWGSL